VTRVFIGGSRRIRRLEAEVRRRLDRIVEKGLPVIIGDANGADKAVERVEMGSEVTKGKGAVTGRDVVVYEEMAPVSQCWK